MKTCVIPTAKTVAAFRDYDFDNCDVPEQYLGDYSHANFFRKYFIPIVRKEIKAMATRGKRCPCRRSRSRDVPFDS